MCVEVISAIRLLLQSTRLTWSRQEMLFGNRRPWEGYPAYPLNAGVTVSQARPCGLQPD